MRFHPPCCSGNAQQQRGVPLICNTTLQASSCNTGKFPCFACWPRPDPTPGPNHTHDHKPQPSGGLGAGQGRSRAPPPRVFRWRFVEKKRPAERMRSLDCTCIRKVDVASSRTSPFGRSTVDTSVLQRAMPFNSLGRRRCAALIQVFAKGWSVFSVAHFLLGHLKKPSICPAPRPPRLPLALLHVGDALYEKKYYETEKPRFIV